MEEKEYMSYTPDYIDRLLPNQIFVFGSNALGYRKPFIAASNVNPEILAEYEVGKQFTNGDMESLRTVLEDFVNLSSNIVRQRGNIFGGF